MELDPLSEESGGVRPYPDQDLPAILSFDDEERVARQAVHRPSHLSALYRVERDYLRVLRGEEIDPSRVAGVLSFQYSQFQETTLNAFAIAASALMMPEPDVPLP